MARSAVAVPSTAAGPAARALRVKTPRPSPKGGTAAGLAEIDRQHAGHAAETLDRSAAADRSRMLAQGHLLVERDCAATPQFQPGDEGAGDGSAALQIAGRHTGSHRRQEARGFGAVVRPQADTPDRIADLPDFGPAGPIELRPRRQAQRHQAGAQQLRQGWRRRTSQSAAASMRARSNNNRRSVSAAWCAARASGALVACP